MFVPRRGTRPHFLASWPSVAGSSLGSRFTGWPARHIPYPQATRASRHCWWREAFPQRLLFTLPSTALPKLFHPPPFLASSIQPSVQPSFARQTTGFSGQHSPSWPPRLCFMLGHRHPRHQEVPFRVSFGWIQSQVQEDRRREAHHPRGHHPMQRLKQPSRLFLQCPQAPPQMLRLRKQGSRRSEMPSSSEKAKPSLPIKLRRGIPCFFNVTYMSSILVSLILYSMVLMPVYGLFMLPLPLLIVPPSSCTLLLTKRWSLTSSTRAVTSAHARDRKSRPSLAPSSLHRCLGSPSQASIEQYTTSRTLIPLTPLYVLLIPPLMRIRTHAPGVPLRQSVTLSLTFPKGLRRPSVMSPKRTTPFPSSLTSGLVWLSGWLTTISLPSMFATTLGSRQLGAFMVCSATPPWTSFVHKGLAPYLNGWMITFSSASLSSTLPPTTPVVDNGMPPSCEMAIAIKLAAAFGIRAKTCQMICLRSLTRMQPTPFRASLISPIVRPLTQCSHTLTLTLMVFPDNSAFHGNLPKLSLSRTWSLTSVLSGTYLTVQWPSLSVKRLSTRLPSKNGCSAPPITWTKPKSFTVSFFTHVWCFRPGVLTSPAWKASWLLSVLTPSFHTMPHVTPPLPSPGGSTHSAPQQSNVP